ncbi:MAG TPA: hypothetical protein VFN30_15595 [Chitinophagaceae bacterium]|nr:hypothetical protein [Chitinophagaceae bacterium]
MYSGSKILICLVIIFSLCGCNGFVREELVVGRYYLVAVDVPQDLDLSYKLEDGSYIGVVRETVFAVGFNDKYIIVKQHPFNNRAITNYYIVPIYKENILSPEKGVSRALTLEQFNEKRKELRIPDEVAFTKEIEELK